MKNLAFEETNHTWTSERIARGEKILEKSRDMHSTLDYIWGEAECILEEAEEIANELQDPCMKREIKEQQDKLKKIMQYLEGYYELEFDYIVDMCQSARIAVVEITPVGFKDNQRARTEAFNVLQFDTGNITRWKGFASAIDELSFYTYDMKSSVMSYTIKESNKCAGVLIAKRITEHPAFNYREKESRKVHPYLEIIAHLVR